MSFDLFLQRFKSGDSADVSRVNVLAALRRHSPIAADEFGFYLVDFPDGSSVEFSAKELEGEGVFAGCAFHVRGFSQSIIELVFDVAKSGDMVILNPQGSGDVTNPVAVLTDASQAGNLPAEALPNPVLSTSSEHLGELFGVGYEHWRAYRDQVVEMNPDR